MALVVVQVQNPSGMRAQELLFALTRAEGLLGSKKAESTDPDPGLTSVRSPALER